jgi:hypothetical protein
MMPSRVALASALAAALFATCSTATATAGSNHPKPRRIGDQRGRGFAADGARYVAFNATTTKLRVFEASAKTSFSIDSRCVVLAGAAARFLLDCSSPAPGIAYSLLDVRKRALVPIPNANAGADRFSDIGKQWLFGSTQDGDTTQLLYLNWHTGARVEVASDQQDSLDRDIDSKSLSEINGVPFDRYFLFGHEKRLSAVRPVRNTSVGNLQLVGPGTRTVLTRTPCQPECAVGTHLVGGRIAWVEPASSGLRVRAYETHKKRNGRWSVRGFPNEDIRSRRINVGLTSKYVIFTHLVRSRFDPTTDDYTAALYRVFAVRW